MTISFSPVAQINLDNPQDTAESIEARISNITEIVDSLAIIYGNQQFRVEQRDEPQIKQRDLVNGPWINEAFGGPETTARNGVVTGTPAENTRTLLNSNSIWDFMFTKPITDIYYSVSELNNQSNPNYVEGYFQGRRLESIYREHLERLDYNNGLRDSINNAVEQIKNLNSVGYQAQLEQAKTLITDVLIEEVTVFNGILQVVSREVNNPQSIIYKPGSPFGPFTSETIAAWDLNFDDLIAGNNNLLSQLNLLYSRLDEIVNLPQDVLARVSLINAGLVQDASDPSQFNLIVPEEKDSWGIRFTYPDSYPASQFVEGRQVNEFESSKGSSIRRRNADNRQGELEASLDLIEANTINTTKDFYFQLLPAIKTNMPSSGSTDVPGAMPGVQFRIENNIVKHKIPGFAPVYQPIGIDSIKCTLVGMFTGHEGIDISSAYLDDISAGLLQKGQTLPIQQSNTFRDGFTGGAGSQYSLANGGPSIAPFAANGQPFSASGAQLPTRNDGVDLPIPAYNRSTTASPVAVLSEDAFRSAQDFYNEIVAQGREVEVELNMRKGSSPVPGGTTGPFRDAETGNPKFKSLIKRMDMYYVRRDRCWFIIDLEITDSGLIGKECINLTNIIEESINLFENVQSIQNLTKQELDDCFRSRFEIKLAHPRDRQVFVVDAATGLSYFYDKLTGRVLGDRNYPMSFRDTMTFIGTNAKTGLFAYEDLPAADDYLPSNMNVVAFFSNLVGRRRIKVITLMVRLMQLYPINLSSTSPDLSIWWLPSDTFSWGTNLNGTAWRLDKNTGKFYYVYDSNGSFVRDEETTKERARTLQEIIQEKKLGFNDGGSVDKFVNFILEDYMPLMQIPEQNPCTDALDALAEEALQRSIAINNGGPDAVQESPEPTRTIFETADFNLIPTTVTEPQSGTTKEQRKAEKENLKAVKESINNQKLNPLLAQAVAEFFNLLEEDRINVPTPTALSPGFVEVLQRAFKSGNLKVLGRSKGFFTFSTSARHIRSNKNELTISAQFKSIDSFTYLVNNTEISIQKDRYYTFSFGVKAFINNGIKEYRVVGIRLNNRIEVDRDRDGEVDREINGDLFLRSEVEVAPQNLEPSSNNPPAVSE